MPQHQQRPERGRLFSQFVQSQAANYRTRRPRPAMTATPPSLTTPPLPPTDYEHDSFLSPHDFFALMPSTMPNGTVSTMNAFGVDGAIPQPPPLQPPAPVDTNGVSSQQPPTQAQGQNGVNAETQADRAHGESSSDEDEDDSEDEGQERSEADRSWYPIIEEKREYVEDELRYWKDMVEHSAQDHTYWEGKAFTDLEDPELRPGTSGRIDFLIDRLNGTREKPNKETVMRSDIVQVGGYEWRLKLYPKGNNTDHLSVYLENVTMQAPEWEATEGFMNPPLPFLASDGERPRKRRCVAAQICVVLYNPTEPRQYEHRMDAHQFTKDSPDYGWTRFTPMRRRDLGMRSHFQRAPLLQDDKLAFKAYIRVIDDPTGCLWDHNSNSYKAAIAATSLRPFARILPMLAADLVLLHFAPFREIVLRWRKEKECSKFASWMNILLWKLLSRERSEQYGEPIDCEQSDAVAWLQRAAKYLREEEGSEAAQRLLGRLDGTNSAAVGGGRLRTREHPSIQAAVEAHETTLETPALLTLELERQHFDGEKREWRRVTNKVSVEDQLTVGDQHYKLFAFVTHCGELSSNSFKTYVRPHGPGSMWYGYSNDRVTCMTHKQALDKRCGSDASSGDSTERSRYALDRGRRDMQSFLDDFEVAHVVFYVREGYMEATFKRTKEFDWTPPQYVKDGKPTEAPTNIPNGSTVVEEKEIPQTEAAKQASVVSNGSDYSAGCATPTHWFMDEDGDVVMSDHEDDFADKSTRGEAIAKVDSKELELQHRTIDNLGCSYYSGQTLRSLYHGQGHLITLNGDEYTGAFSHGNKHGPGRMVYAGTGDIYDGEWAGDLRHGSGKYIESKTGNVFDGTWSQGKKSGKFVLTGTVTEEDKSVCNICYERELDTAFYDCGHVVACLGCAQQIEDCPVCRRRIVSRLQLFGVKVSVE